MNKWIKIKNKKTKNEKWKNKYKYDLNDLKLKITNQNFTVCIVIKQKNLFLKSVKEIDDTSK